MTFDPHASDDDWGYDPDAHDYDDHGDYCDCEECQYERDADECGELPKHLGGGCTLVGTEHCDFDCPFSDRVLEREVESDE